MGVVATSGALCGFSRSTRDLQTSRRFAAQGTRFAGTACDSHESHQRHEAAEREQRQDIKQSKDRKEPLEDHHTSAWSNFSALMIGGREKNFFKKI